MEPSGEQPIPLEATTDIERIKREEKLAALFEQGLDSPDIIALHGTSLEALSELIKSGRLPSGKTEGGVGYLYFFRLDVPVPEDFLNGETPEENIQGGVKMYAKDLAYEASLCRILGLDFNEDREFLEMLERIRSQHELRSIAGRGEELVEAHLLNGSKHQDIIAGYIEKYGFPAIKSAFGESIERKGIIIGLNKEILNHNPQSAYQELDDEGWRINLPEGIPLEYISGLEPIGQPEYDFFIALQEKYEAPPDTE